MQSMVADRIGIIAWFLSFGLAICVDMCRFATWCCEMHCNGYNGYMNVVHGACIGEEIGIRNLVFFRVKCLQPTKKGISCVRRLRLRRFIFFSLPHCNGGLVIITKVSPSFPSYYQPPGFRSSLLRYIKYCIL